MDFGKIEIVNYVFTNNKNRVFHIYFTFHLAPWPSTRSLAIDDRSLTIDVVGKRINSKTQLLIGTYNYNGFCHFNKSSNLLFCNLFLYLP